MQHPVGGQSMHKEGEHRGMEGKFASIFINCSFHVEGQGIEFNRSFRKLSGSLISDKRPGKQSRQKPVRSWHAQPPASLSHAAGSTQRTRCAPTSSNTAAHWEISNDWGCGHQASSPCIWFCKEDTSPVMGSRAVWGKGIEVAEANLIISPEQRF